MSIILFFHVTAGIIALFAGAGALTFRKGSKRHRQSGNVFFVSMLVMAASGAYIALIKFTMVSVTAGLATFYLVATAWLTVRRKADETGRLEWVALIAALAIFTFAMLVGAGQISGDTTVEKGIPQGMGFFFAVVIGFAALMDMRLLYRGGLRGAQRLIRHLWRMCFGMYTATSSFFLGQPQLFPDYILEIHLNAIPVVIVVFLLFFWLIRVAFSKRYKEGY
ncbi:MAG: DUF2306 domain-containing protein [Gammaproteobacteria bacterium]|nr:DUF2306 domain-containing protein [Gammaproteobacteria bacterium]